MYTTIDFKSKMELMAAFKSGRPITVFNPAGGRVPNGVVQLEGPHHPAPPAHRWYVAAFIRRGRISSILSLERDASIAVVRVTERDEPLYT